AALMSASAWAQTQQVAANGDAETVVVTGSLITRPGYSAPTPVEVVSSQDLLGDAPNTIADTLNQLPQVGVGSTPIGAWQGTTASGVNTINLRNLGVTRTLVLLDGDRIVPFSTANTIDINL